MTAKPRYIYFNFKGRGELPRLVCAAGGVEIEDERINFDQWKTQYKDKTPFSQIPCVVIDEEWFAQKLAISKYFASKCGFYPGAGNDLVTLKVDQAVLFLEEILEGLIKAHIDKQFNQKPETMTNMKDEVLPKKLPMIEKLLFKSGTGFYVGHRLSLADLQAFDLIDQIVNEFGKSFLDPYPLVKANFEKVSQIEGIKEYLKNRPPPLEGFNW